MPSRQHRRGVKVLHIVGDSRFGGAASIIMGLARVAQAEGWNVDVLATDPVFQAAARQQGVGVVDLDVIRREIRPLWDLGGLFRLRRFLRAESYDIVHTHTSKAGFVGRLAATLANVPVILHTVHGFAFHEASPPSTRLFYSALERCASQWCDRIVSVSEFHREWAIRLGMCNANRIVAIPNGIAEPVLGKHDRAKIRGDIGAGSGDLLAVSIGRLAPDKGLEYLIEAAAMLPSDCRIRIALAGDGPARDPLIQLASRAGVSDRVRFIGFRRDVAELLAASDLVILPSLREGLSISLLEAMAAAKPIIATSIGSQREVAGHGEMAWLVPPADGNALRGAMLQLTADPPMMARLAANARAVYESCYTEQRMLHSYRQLYIELASAKLAGAASCLEPSGPSLPEPTDGHAPLDPRLHLPKGAL